MKTKKSIKELAKLIDCSQQAIYRWLHGERAISLKNALALQRATGIRLELWLPGKIEQNQYYKEIRAYKKKIVK